MTPPDIPARCPYDFFTSVTPSQLTLMDHSEELHPEGPAYLKTTSQSLLRAAEVLAPTTPVALADSTLLAITCKVSGHKTWFGMSVSSIPDTSSSQCSSSSNPIPMDSSKIPKLTDKGKSISYHPQKDTKVAKLKVVFKPSASQSSSSGSKTSNIQRSIPKLKIGIKPKKSEELKVSTRSNAKGILGAGRTHLNKCPNATKVEKIAKVRMNAPKVKKVTKAEKSAKGSKGIWYLDSGCSRHMTGQKDLLTEYREEKGPSVTFGGNGKGYTRGFGVLSNGTTTFRRVAYVDGLKHNLLNISQLCDKDFQRLSHINFKTLNTLSSKELVSGLPRHSYAKESLCSACEKGKQTKASFKSKQVSSVRSPLQLLHMDLFGPVNIQSITGKKYTLVIQNGVTERRNRTIIEAARSLLTDSHLPAQFWPEVINTACFTQNRSLIVKRFNKTAYELFHGRKPSINFLHIFGCQCFILNNRDTLGKFDPKANEGVFLGYSSISKAYMVFNKGRQIVEETIHVTFDESRSSNSKPITDNEELNAWMFSHYGETELLFNSHHHAHPTNADDVPDIIPPNTESTSWVSTVPLNTFPPSDISTSETPTISEDLSVNDV
ncbi:hypothetical protein L6452_41984 [Arctium lappa]|uniref:Uncharacterized protein n=1 Tax=Arctium lappa TaxID=4217 RepID=A0ACB8XGG7_ARCLA|nr:hypothetical protein L6452_41984 [Arctium lappa]